MAEQLSFDFEKTVKPDYRTDHAGYMRWWRANRLPDKRQEMLRREAQAARTRRQQSGYIKPSRNRKRHNELARKSAARRRKENPEKYNAPTRERYATDIQFKIQMRLRGRLWALLKGRRKEASAVTDLGCTLDEFRTYIEQQFRPGMSWGNWGVDTWHLDHKRPLSSFDLTDPAQCRVAFHFTNYQPLFATENHSKHAKWFPVDS